MNPFSEREQKIICRPSDSTTIHWHGSIRRDPTVRSCLFAFVHFCPSDHQDPTVRYVVPCCVRFFASFCVLCVSRLCSCGILVLLREQELCGLVFSAFSCLQSHDPGKLFYVSLFFYYFPSFFLFFWAT